MLIIITISTSIIFSLNLWGQNNNFKLLTLSSAIETGLRENNQEKSRKYEKTILDLSWKNTKESFWLPNIEITLSSGPQRLANLYKGNKSGDPTNLLPTGSLSLNFGEYTIFNWGKDYLDYKNKQDTYIRNKEQLAEKKRELKHDLIIEYFKTMMYYNITKINKNLLRHASFIYKTNKEKNASAKVSSQDYYRSRTEYIKSQRTYQEVERIHLNANEDMAHKLNDNSKKIYIFDEKLKFIKLSLQADEIIKLANINNYKIKDAQVNLKNADRLHRLTIKENIPLPRFYINFGAYKHNFSRDTANSRYTTNLDNSDLELIASINATWNITGKGGLFNSREVTISKTKKYLAYHNYKKTNNDIELILRKYYYNIKQYESKVEFLQLEVENALKTFNIVLQNYLNKRSSFTDFKLALEDMINSQIQYEKTKFAHLKDKILLLKSIGIESFPGERLEDLSIKEK